MITRSQNGHPLYGVTFLLTLAALKALDVTEHVPGERFTLTDGRTFYWAAGSTATADDVVIVAPTAGSGRYIITTGRQDLPLACSAATLDNATLLTIPTGMVACPVDAYWEVTTGFTGGSSAAIGIDSSNAGWNTAGDILGGAGGDVTATLGTAGIKLGTVGAKLDTLAEMRVALVAADTIRFQRIVDVFAAGAGFAHLVLNIYKGPTA